GLGGIEPGLGAFEIGSGRALGFFLFAGAGGQGEACRRLATAGGGDKKCQPAQQKQRGGGPGLPQGVVPSCVGPRSHALSPYGNPRCQNPAATGPVASTILRGRGKRGNRKLSVVVGQCRLRLSVRKAPRDRYAASGRRQGPTQNPLPCRDVSVLWTLAGGGGFKLTLARSALTVTSNRAPPETADRRE